MTLISTAASTLAPQFDSSRLQAILDRESVSALIVLSGTNIYYATGTSGFYGMIAGGVSTAILTPGHTDPRPMMVVVESEIPGMDMNSVDVRPYPTFMYLEDPYNQSAVPLNDLKTHGFGLETSAPVVADALRSRGVTGKLAVEWSALDEPSARFLRDALSSWETIDAGKILTEARKIKSPWEIDRLSRAVSITEDVISKVISEVSESSTQRSITSRFLEYSYAHDDVDGIRLCLVTVGPNFAPAAIARDDRATPESIIKLDVGVTVGFHGADIARAFCVGEPAPEMQRRYDALLAGHTYLQETIAPGVPISDVFNNAMNIIRDAGLPDYSRGHLGHSVGIGPSPEEHPVLGEVPDVFEEGMVFCIETPYYGFGLGSLQIEDMVVVTKDGISNLNKLSHELVRL
ncbi:M24 family metallopeptidase [Pseudarthrobacter sp. YAF2]|uniref:M24 family metallopeptidase n=1 Tax=Pseudarthrobacter sp. YAF2 TaxID=3233078 RepID=UPI003F979CD7